MSKLNNIYSQETNNYIEMVQLDGETGFGSASCSAMEEQIDTGLMIADEYISPLATYLENGPRSFSPSSLQTYLHCPRQYFYKYVMGLPPVEGEPDVDASAEKAVISSMTASSISNAQATLISSLSAKDLGSVIHRALELYKGDLDAALAQAIKENAPLYEGDEARKMLERYLASNLYKRIPKKQLREQAFTLYAENDIVLSGIIDCLAFNTDGSLLIVDYKTGRPPIDGEPDVGYAYQLAIYEKVVRERWARGQQPKLAAELHFLRNNTSWSLQEGNEKQGCDYYAAALKLCEEIAKKSTEAEFPCIEPKAIRAEQNNTNYQNDVTESVTIAKNIAAGVALCPNCPYNYVCNHK